MSVPVRPKPDFQTDSPVYVGGVHVSRSVSSDDMLVAGEITFRLEFLVLALLHMTSSMFERRFYVSGDTLDSSINYDIDYSGEKYFAVAHYYFLIMSLVNVKSI